MCQKAEAVDWVSLEDGNVVEDATHRSNELRESVPPGYPSSNPKARDWEALEREAQEDEEKEEPSGDAALNKLFQQIYKNADDDTKRAMMKSFQTSGGTVLSTNWSEVSKKNYEEEIEAPAGMQVNRWNQ